MDMTLVSMTSYGSLELFWVSVGRSLQRLDQIPRFRQESLLFRDSGERYLGLANFEDFTFTISCGFQDAGCFLGQPKILRQHEGETLAAQVRQGILLGGSH